MTTLDRIRSERLPEHVALIMDGNGRWAKARGLPRTAGHRAGSSAAERLVRFAGERIGLKNVTLFAFSSENWSRPKEEVDFLMELLREFIDEKIGEFVQKGTRLLVAGVVEGLPPAFQETVKRAVRETKGGDRMTVTVALNYGGRQDIVQACARIAHEVAEGRLSADDVDETVVSSRLLTNGAPDPDLVIRTSGELRISNFLLWQSAYSELYFTQKCWPDFTPADLVLAIEDFQRRERRYGGLEGSET